MITEKWLLNQEARSSMAESVEFYIDDWKQLLSEIRNLKNLAEKLQSFFNCPDGSCVVQGKMNRMMGEIITDTAAVIHSLKYSDVSKGGNS